MKLRIEAADEIEKLRRNLRHWREECGKVSGGVAQGWRDISTAPKDGSTIDLWCLNISHGSTDSVRVPDAFWDDEVSKWEDRHGWILESKWRPTHWMPLPTGPSVPSTVSEPAQAAPTGFDRAEGYIASLRQMAACNYVDFDELTDIADFMEGTSPLPSTSGGTAT